MSSIKWYFMQLLPLKYRSHYKTSNENEYDTLNYTVWRMWFGKCFNVKNRQWKLNID